jgi:hypothetical protein
MASVEMKLVPWTAPNFARLEMPARPKQDGMSELPAIPVADLSAEALTMLAEQWLYDLYAKAGKPQNWAFTFPKPTA